MLTLRLFNIRKVAFSEHLLCLEDFKGISSNSLQKVLWDKYQYFSKVMKEKVNKLACSYAEIHYWS